MSAVVPVRTSGVYPTGMPRRVASATSMFSKPTAIWLMAAEVGGGVHELGVYLVGKEAEEAVYVGDLLQEGLVRRGEFVGPEFHVGLGGDHVDGLLEDAAGDEDFGFGHSGSWAEMFRAIIY